MEIFKPRDAIKNFSNRDAIELEFINPGSGAIFLAEGTGGNGTIDNNFVSGNFERCSGFMFKSKLADRYAFFHALPGTPLWERDFEKLAALAGGEVVLIESPASTKKPWITGNLSRKLSIEQVGLISVGSYPFDVLFKPKENLVYVHRGDNRYNDVLAYSVF